MIEIQGAYNTARCFTDTLEEQAAGQIKSVCDQAVFRGCKLRIMPDVHAGMGCTIGTTMTVMDEIVRQIGLTVDIVDRIHPIYNFKAAE